MTILTRLGKQKPKNESAKTLHPIALVKNGVLGSCISNILATTTRELTALGAQVRIAGDDLIIKGVDAFTGGEVDSHNDHRIAMMAAIAASRATGEVVIHGAEAVNNSYPDFFDHYRLLGGKVTLEEE